MSSPLQTRLSWESWEWKERTEFVCMYGSTFASHPTATITTVSPARFLDAPPMPRRLQGDISSGDGSPPAG